MEKIPRVEFQSCLGKFFRHGDVRFGGGIFLAIAGPCSPGSAGRGVAPRPAQLGEYGPSNRKEDATPKSHCGETKVFPTKQRTLCDADAKLEASPLRPRRFLQAVWIGHDRPTNRTSRVAWGNFGAVILS